MNVEQVREKLRAYPDDWEVRVIRKGRRTVRLSVLPPKHPDAKTVDDVGEFGDGSKVER